MPTETNRVLVKMRPSNALKAAESRANLRPLYDSAQAMARPGFGLDATPQWFIAELPDGADMPWDLAHARVADQLGVAESDVIFAEPDIIHDVYEDTNEERTRRGLRRDEDRCATEPAGRYTRQGGRSKRRCGTSTTTSRSSAARARRSSSPIRARASPTSTPATTRSHVTRPASILRRSRAQLRRGRRQSGQRARIPNNERRILDNSGHGTGTLSILAGGARLAPFDVVLGGAPERRSRADPRRRHASCCCGPARWPAHSPTRSRSGCDVITMSMGGLPSQAWAEAVDRLYEAGIVFCAAAGNRTRPAPPSVLVYPARYPRVIAVAGRDGQRPAVHEPQDRALEGSFGPDEVDGDGARRLHAEHPVGAVRLRRTSSA